MRDAQGRWRYSTSTYNGLHQRINDLLGQPRVCVHCGTEEAKSYDWANLSGRFEDPEDYIRLCRACHIKFDEASDHAWKQCWQCLVCGMKSNPGGLARHQKVQDHSGRKRIA